LMFEQEAKTCRCRGATIGGGTMKNHLKADHETSEQQQTKAFSSLTITSLVRGKALKRWFGPKDMSYIKAPSLVLMPS
jgi:hypothetical protein